MKFRQAKKIIIRERTKYEKKGVRSWYGWLYGSSQWNKAVTVYIHHVKKTTDWFEKNGTLSELRKFYERKK